MVASELSKYKIARLTKLQMAARTSVQPTNAEQTAAVLLRMTPADRLALDTMPSSAAFATLCERITTLLEDPPIVPHASSDIPASHGAVMDGDPAGSSSSDDVTDIDDMPPLAPTAHDPPPPPHYIDLAADAPPSRPREAGQRAPRQDPADDGPRGLRPRLEASHTARISRGAPAGGVHHPPCPPPHLHQQASMGAAAYGAQQAPVGGAVYGGGAAYGAQHPPLGSAAYSDVAFSHPSPYPPPPHAHAYPPPPHHGIVAAPTPTPASDWLHHTHTVAAPRAHHPALYPSPGHAHSPVHAHPYAHHPPTYLADHPGPHAQPYPHNDPPSHHHPAQDPPYLHPPMFGPAPAGPPCPLPDDAAPTTYTTELERWREAYERGTLMTLLDAWLQFAVRGLRSHDARAALTTAKDAFGRRFRRERAAGVVQVWQGNLDLAVAELLSLEAAWRAYTASPAALRSDFVAEATTALLAQGTALWGPDNLRAIDNALAMVRTVNALAPGPSSQRHQGGGRAPHSSGRTVGGKPRRSHQRPGAAAAAGKRPGTGSS